MSGGFFRGTSADQDTRFSNKQAKLLKSQKFPAELDHLIDMTKVKMDVIRPWIATRATELLGFEDEVLINFVYGLLDVKVVDGKKIQIQLTGFMEKNTGKFMKELWILLLSAQNNVSGVPQQFLDAKEEEQKKKKEENEKISQEIQRRKERAGRDFEREKVARMDDEEIDPKFRRTGPDLVSRTRASGVKSEEEKKSDMNHVLKSSNGEEHKLRSSSPYSQSPRRSISPKKQNHTSARFYSSPIKQHRPPPRDSISRSPTPTRQHRSPRQHRGSSSPVRRRSPHFRQRSNSHSPDLHPSPYYSWSHARRRSPYPSRRSPPSHRKSPSPMRHRSPLLRRRSPSPMHHRSLSPPIHRSPMHSRRKSPARYDSISPIRRSPLPLHSKYRKQSPYKSPARRHADSYNSLRQRNRSPSPIKRDSPLNRRGSYKMHNNLDEIGKSERSYDERAQRRPSAHHSFEKEPSSYVGADKFSSHLKYQGGKRISLRENSRSVSPYKSPVVGRGGSISHNESSDISREEEITPTARDAARYKKDITHKQNSFSRPVEDSYTNENSHGTLQPERSPVVQFPAARQLKSEIKFSDMGNRQKGKAQPTLQFQENIEYGPGGTRGGQSRLDTSPKRRVKKELDINSKAHFDSENPHYMSKHNEHEETLSREHSRRSRRKLDQDHRLNSKHSDSDNDQNTEKQQNSSETSENDSQIDNKKEAKRRRKEEKRLLRKEEKRRVREERRRRRSERRVARQKVRSTDALGSFSGFEKHSSGADDSDGDVQKRKSSHTSQEKETDSEQKKLEIELRKKALESLRAKKAIND